MSMQSRILGFTVAAAVCSCVVLGVSARDMTSDGAGEMPDLQGGVLELRERMGGLSPDDPMGYFELAEELAYLSALTPNQRRTSLQLASQLYVLAYELDRRSSSPRGLGTSVCLALADIAPHSERDWLLALAASFGTDDTLANGFELGTGSFDDDAMFDAAEALGRYRAVERRPLSTIMRRIDVRAQMIRAGVDAQDADWAMERLNQGLNRPFCPECRNQRVARVGTSNQDVELILCRTCFGNPEPDPPLSADDLRRMLAIEATLLGASPRTWSAQHKVGGWRPIPDLDPAGLAARYNVDPTKVYWIADPQSALIGRWSESPGD